MNGASKHQEAPSDDIDLLRLIERVLSFFKRYRWLFIIAIVLGILAGIWRYRSTPNVYKSRLVMHSFILTNQNQIQIVSGWNALLKSGEHQVLATAFNCPEEVLHHVKEIKAEEIQKVFTANNPNGFLVDVMVTDTGVLDRLEKGIVSGFENSPYIKERLLVKRARLKELIQKTSAEIAKLDSTKKVMDNLISGRSSVSTSIIVDASSVNRLLIEMNEKLLNLNEELTFANAVQVLQSFSKFRNPAGPRLLVCLFIGLVFFGFLAFMVALLHSINQKIRLRARQQPATIG